MVGGDLLVEARRRAGISQAELSRRSGVPPSLIGRYERYEVTPSLERLRSLIRAAGFELSMRLARVDPSNHDQVLIERELRRTPAERLRRGLMAGRRAAPLPCDAAMPRTADLATLPASAGDHDICFTPSGTRGYLDLRREASRTRIDPGISVSVASLRDVIRSKEAAGRDEDLAQ